MGLLDESDEFLKLSALVASLITKLELMNVINEEDKKEIMAMADMNFLDYRKLNQ